MTGRHDGNPALRARIAGDSNPEAWFPWAGRGRPNLFRQDRIRVELRNGVFSNSFEATDHDSRYYDSPGDYGVVAIGVRLDAMPTVRRMEALTGYRVDPAAAAAAMEASAVGFEQAAGTPGEAGHDVWMENAARRRKLAEYYRAGGAADAAEGRLSEDLRKTAAILEACLEKAEKADPDDAPFGLDGERCRLWHQAQAAAYRHALEMLPMQAAPEHAAPNAVTERGGSAPAPLAG